MPVVAEQHLLPLPVPIPVPVTNPRCHSMETLGSLFSLAVKMIGRVHSYKTILCSTTGPSKKLAEAASRRIPAYSRTPSMPRLQRPIHRVSIVGLHYDY
jgi:hypothetical protein